jgi:hypothetical protein
MGWCSSVEEAIVVGCGSRLGEGDGEGEGRTLWRGESGFAERAGRGGIAGVACDSAASGRGDFALEGRGGTLGGGCEAIGGQCGQCCKSDLSKRELDWGEAILSVGEVLETGGPGYKAASEKQEQRLL